MSSADAHGQGTTRAGPPASGGPARFPVLILGAVLGMAVSAPAIRYADAAPLAVVSWRVGLCWPIIALVALLRREAWPLARGTAAGVFLAVHWVTWVIAVQRTTISTAALLISTGALWSAVASRPLLGEGISRRQWAGLALALAGAALVVTAAQGGRHTLIGDLFALAGSVAWVGYTFIGRRARERSGFWGYAATVYGVAGIAAWAAALASGAALAGYDGRTWGALAAMALFPTLVGHGILNYMLRYMGPARLSLWTLCEPVVSTGAAWILFAEIPPVQALLGGAVTLAGIALGVS